LLKYPQLWATIFNSKSYASDLTKNELGYTLGDFFINSSGQPVANGIPPCCQLPSLRISGVNNYHLPNNNHNCDWLGLHTLILKVGVFFFGGDIFWQCPVTRDCIIGIGMFEVEKPGIWVLKIEYERRRLF
jgi:hypothetical protein